METVLKRLRRRSPDAARARQLYREAFPPNERAPFFLLVRRAEKGLADWWSVCEGNEWRGFFYVVSDADLAYVFYLAVDPAARGKGCGILAECVERVQICVHKRVVLQAAQHRKPAQLQRKGGKLHGSSLLGAGKAAAMARGCPCFLFCNSIAHFGGHFNIG